MPVFLDRWHQFSQATSRLRDTLPTLMSFSALVTEGEAQILFRFKAGCREDLRTKLLARRVIVLKKAYALVQDLDVVRSNHAFRSHDQRAPVSRSSPST